MQELSILLVEDDDDLRGLMRRHLAGHGYRIAEAAGVREARGVLDASVPDLLILDIGLPDGTGWDVARYLRALAGGDIPIVVCSSHEPSAADLEGCGVQGYIPKPFNLGALSECVVAALASPKPGYVAAAAAEEADDREVAFYSSLAHDMRTPMAILRTAVESLLADDVTWDEDARRELEVYERRQRYEVYLVEETDAHIASKMQAQAVERRLRDHMKRIQHEAPQFRWPEQTLREFARRRLREEIASELELPTFEQFAQREAGSLF
jgi:DNA-binding response OmpR family regulator